MSASSPADTIARASVANVGALLARRSRRLLERCTNAAANAMQAAICQSVARHQSQWPVDRPLVTIVIPCFNYGLLIHQALESALAQTFQRLEVIVIDDGSTDAHTRSVLGGLEREGIRVVVQANQGLAETRNNGAKLAAGKYLCFLDADDLLAPEYIESAIALLEADERLGSCYSWVQCFGKIDSVWKTRDLDPFFLRQSTTAPSHSVIRKAAWDAVAKRNGAGFLSKYNGFFEDWVFWIDMVLAGYGGRAIARPLIRYRVHDGSLSAANRDRFDEMLAQLRVDRREFFQDRPLAKALRKTLNTRIRIVNSRVNLDLGGSTRRSAP